jgi:hypothetical protein
MVNKIAAFLGIWTPWILPKISMYGFMILREK